MIDSTLVDDCHEHQTLHCVLRWEGCMGRAVHGSTGDASSVATSTNADLAYAERQATKHKTHVLPEKIVLCSH